MVPPLPFPLETRGRSTPDSASNATMKRAGIGHGERNAGRRKQAIRNEIRCPIRAFGSPDLHIGDRTHRGRKCLEQIRLADSEILGLELRKPILLPAGVVQFHSAMHPAHPPQGYRFLQFDWEHRLSRSERAESVAASFDAPSGGDERLEPLHPVSAAICLGDVTLRGLRFQCHPGESAYSGSEAIPAQAD